MTQRKKLRIIVKVDPGMDAVTVITNVTEARKKGYNVKTIGQTSIVELSLGLKIALDLLKPKPRKNEIVLTIDGDDPEFSDKTDRFWNQ